MNQVKAGALLNYIIIGLNTMLGLLYTPYMLRMLGQNEYGLYSLVASLIAYLTIMDFGFGNAIIRYTATFRALQKHSEQWEMFGMFTIVYSVIGIIAFVIGCFLYLNVDALFDRTMTAEDLSLARKMMVFLMINLAITFPFSIFGSIITAYEDFVFQKLVQIVRLLLSTALIVVLLYEGYKAIAMVVVQTAFNIGVLMLNCVYCFCKLKIKIRFNRFNWPFFKEISAYSFWIFLNAIMDRIYWSTGQFVLGSVSGTIAVSIFSVAITLEHMFMTFSSAISGVLLPKITNMVAKNCSHKELSNIFISTGRIQSIVLFLILCGFVVLGRGFIVIWAGNEYSESYIVTLIFFVALFIPLIQNIGISILQARNQLKFRSLMYIAIAIVSLLFQIWLSKLYGAIGCAIAIGGALLLGQGFVMNVYYQRKQGLDIVAFWQQIGKISIVPILLIGVGLTSWRFIDYGRPQNLLLGGIAMIISYCIFMWIYALNNREKQFFIQVFSKLRRSI